MHIIDVEQGSEEWHKARAGKITGSKLKNVVSSSTPLKADITAELDKLGIEYKKTSIIPELMELLPPQAAQALKAKVPKKLGFYEILAEKIAYEKGDENPMERGIALEDEARQKLEVLLDEEIETVGLCVHDTVPDIAVSPDGIIRKNGHIYYAVEIKCLGTARHLQAVIEKNVPDDYKQQVLQYFIVLEELEVLYFTFYDPRVVGHELFVIEVHRKDIAEEAEQYFNWQKEALDEINRLATEYSNF